MSFDPNARWVLKLGVAHRGYVSSLIVNAGSFDVGELQDELQASEDLLDAGVQEAFRRTFHDLEREGRVDVLPLLGTTFATPCLRFFGLLLVGHFAERVDAHLALKLGGDEGNKAAMPIVDVDAERRGQHLAEYAERCLTVFGGRQFVSWAADIGFVGNKH